MSGRGTASGAVDALRGFAQYADVGAKRPGDLARPSLTGRRRGRGPEPRPGPGPGRVGESPESPDEYPAAKPSPVVRGPGGDGETLAAGPDDERPGTTTAGDGDGDRDRNWPCTSPVGTEVADTRVAKDSCARAQSSDAGPGGGSRT